MINLRHFVDFFFYGRHRLEKVPTVPLGSSIGEAIKLYGEPVKKERPEDFLESVQYTFSVGPYHQAVISELEGRISSITYWSARSDPARDLRYMLECYKEDSQWDVLEEGYWYQRLDGEARLWCSAMPAIGVAFTKFFRANAAFAKRKALEELKDLKDPHWASKEAISELQRLACEGDASQLTEFVARSEKIAASPDGRHVFIVRRHLAGEAEDGFYVRNSQPDEEGGYSTQVLNCFTWAEDGTSWMKATLPRNADVECLRFEGDQCHLCLRQVASDRELEFTGPAESIRGLCGLAFGAMRFNDQDLWQKLEAYAEQMATRRHD